MELDPTPQTKRRHMPPGMRSLNVVMTIELFEKLAAAAEREDRSFSNMANVFIKRGMKASKE
ncbi:MAG: hypothetical protein WC763_07425 [Candidatus Paceibacterota bacterium]|jgi:hypothetical protein